jgi:hypothetical protein
MAEPKWVMAFGACASTGGFYDNYATLPGIDRIVPVDIYVPGCPPRPEAVLDGLMALQRKIQRSKHPLGRRAGRGELARDDGRAHPHAVPGHPGPAKAVGIRRARRLHGGEEGARGAHAGALIDMVKASNLRGRGGAGFPTG